MKAPPRASDSVLDLFRFRWSSQRHCHWVDSETCLWIDWMGHLEPWDPLENMATPMRMERLLCNRQFCTLFHQMLPSSRKGALVFATRDFTGSTPILPGTWNIAFPWQTVVFPYSTEFVCVVVHVLRVRLRVVLIVLRRSTTTSTSSLSSTVVVYDYVL